MTLRPRRSSLLSFQSIGALLIFSVGGYLPAQNTPATPGAPIVVVNWPKKMRIHTTPTLQAVVNPMLRRGSPIHGGAFTALHDLGCDYVRYAFWLPYPKLAVAELRPPDQTHTYWDFQYMDPIVEDFLGASDGHPAVWSFSTIPQWMFTTPQPAPYPDDPNQVTWTYTQGKDLPDLPGLGDYYGRVASWYMKGGFTDELGKFHASGHHYDMRYWEVFNEVDNEHEPTPQQYVERYDAIVEGVRKVAPDMKFVGLALSYPEGGEHRFEYFLDPRNHRPGIPLDYISFHVYAAPGADQNADNWQFTFFDRANEFLSVTRYILRIRDRLSPATKIMVNEAGSILSGDMVQGEPNHIEKAIPASYWNLSGALYAYLYVQLANLGVDIVGESQLVGYPSQFPSVTMVDWTTGKPNARMEVLRLLKDNVGPGDDFSETEVRATNGNNADADAVLAQGYTRGGQRKLILINQRNRDIVVDLPKDCVGSTMQSIAGASPDLMKRDMPDTKLSLAPYAVAILTLKN